MAPTVLAATGAGEDGARQSRPMAPAPVIREACFEDHAEIAALQSRHGLAARCLPDWSSLWTANPAYAARRPYPIGWVLENTGGTIGGYLGNLPLDYRLGGSTIRAATPYSWVVDADLRCHSLTLLHRFLNQPAADLFVCTTPNGAAEKVLRAFRFSRAPSGSWDRAGFWITGYYGFTRSTLLAAPLPLPRGLAHPLSAALFLSNLLRSDPARGKGTDAEFELCAGFDARFDDFWQESLSQNGDRLLAIRNRQTLEWHFRLGLARNQVSILAASRNGRLAAYAIIDRLDNPTLGLKRLRFVDFQALRGYEGLLRPALAWMLRRCRSEQLHVAEVVGCWLDRIQASGCAPPHHRRLQSWLFYYLTHDAALGRQLQDPRIWMPSSYDGDASI
ncbi:MAG TPA: hypothetical protein VMU80_12065 [Bryobacteraceae bacterium]|nr:hypothetical protein [Bryobacteraceae bacterium]